MSERFSEEMYHRHLLHADVRGAAEYLHQFQEQAQLTEQFEALFDEERTMAPTENETINAVIAAYTAYYREAFWVQMVPAAAAINLTDRLRRIFDIPEPTALQTIEDTFVSEAFAAAGLHFLGGCTGGWRGPYIWRDTEARSYTIELPEGTEVYTVKLLSGFVHKSWLDYISLGAIGTGGWVDDDGTICCIQESYDLESENFRVSLLKHEAQHAQDKARYPRIKPHELEYRAKLVETIYSTERSMAEKFLHEASPDMEAGDHAYAAELLVEGLCRLLTCQREQLTEICRCKVIQAAKQLLAESSTAMVSKYSRRKEPQA